MALGNLSAPTTRKAHSASMRETFIAPMMLPVCCVCGLIRDATQSFPDRECWITSRTYRKTHGANPADFPLTHTYCPKCFTKAQETTKQCFREMGTSP